jgi:hypothetical protein
MKMMIKDKRALSVMVGYVLLVAIAVVMSIIVYQWISSYAPKDVPDCPDGVSLLLEDVVCATTGPNIGLSFILRNRGRFNVDGYLIHVTNSSDQEIATINLAGNLTSGGTITGESIRFKSDGSLEPGGEVASNFYIANPDFGEINKIEIKPFRFETIEGRKRFVVCGKSRTFEEVNCNAGSVDDGIFDPQDLISLVSWWSFEGGDLADKEGLNVLSNPNSAVPVLGRVGDGMSFDGVNQYLEATSSTSLDDIQESSHTISLFYKPEATTSTQGLFAKEGNHMGIFYDPIEKEIFSHYWVGEPSSAQERTSYNSADAITFDVGNFYHIVAVYDNSGIAPIGKVYVDGSYKGTATFAEGDTITEYGTSTWKIGASDSDGAYNQFSKGVLDEVMIFNKALTPTEVQKLQEYFA